MERRPSPLSAAIAKRNSEGILADDMTAGAPSKLSCAGSAFTSLRQRSHLRRCIDCHKALLFKKGYTFGVFLSLTVAFRYTIQDGQSVTDRDNFDLNTRVGTIFVGSEDSGTGCAQRRQPNVN